MSEETKLIRGLKKSDKKAMEEFYSKYSGLVYYYAYKFIPNKEDCEELIQDTFLTVFKKINTLKSPEALKSWLATITLNKCRDWSVPLRAEKRTADIVEEDISEIDNIDAGSEFLPEEILEQKEIKDFLSSMVESLPYKQKVAIMDFYFQELSLREISEKEECSVASVKNALYKGKQTLKSQIEAIQIQRGSEEIFIPKRHMASIPVLTQVLQENMAGMSMDPVLNSAWSGIQASLGTVSTGIGVKSFLLSAKFLLSVGAVVILISVIGVVIYSSDRSDDERPEKKTEKQIEEFDVQQIENSSEEITDGIISTIRIFQGFNFPGEGHSLPIDDSYLEEKKSSMSDEDLALLEWLKNNGATADRNKLVEILNKYGFSKDVMMKMKKNEKLSLYSYTFSDSQIVIAERYDDKKNIWNMNYKVYKKSVPLNADLLLQLLGINS